jgi:hypothetical protein
MGKLCGQFKPFWNELISRIIFPYYLIKPSTRCGDTLVGPLFLPTMFPASFFVDSPSKSTSGALDSPSKSILHTPVYQHLPVVLPTTMDPLPTPPYATPIPPPVLHLLNAVRPHSIYQLLRYWGLPKEPAMYTKGYTPFRNATLSFLATNRHAEYKPCVEPTWYCEFRSLTTEMENYGKRGMNELVKYTCEARTLLLDMVSFFLFASSLFHTFLGLLYDDGLP